MHPETFEQLELQRSVLGGSADFLADGVLIRVSSFGKEILAASLPDTVELEVATCGATMKNERTDGKQLKAAQLVNGAEVQVPGYIKEGDKVIVKPATGEFVRRVL
jgi:elongation factor P